MQVKADLHIHTVLSPCGDLDMSPRNIVDRAVQLGLNMIAITDHNSTKNARVTAELGKEQGLAVMCGAEITTAEEVHCVCLLPDDKALNDFQQFIESKVVFFPNSVEKFGYQLVVDKNEDVVEEIPYLLINALNCPLEDLQKVVDEMNGIFIPAHVDRPTFSIYSQLGFVPPDLKFDVMELSKYAAKSHFLENNSLFQNYNYIRSSDAHFLENIGEIFTTFDMKSLDFNGLKAALKDYSVIKS